MPWIPKGDSMASFVRVPSRTSFLQGHLGLQTACAADRTCCMHAMTSTISTVHQRGAAGNFFLPGFWMAPKQNFGGAQRGQECGCNKFLQQANTNNQCQPLRVRKGETNEPLGVQATMQTNQCEQFFQGTQRTNLQILCLAKPFSRQRAHNSSLLHHASPQMCVAFCCSAR